MLSLLGFIIYLTLEMIRPDVLLPGVQESIMFWVAVATATVWVIETFLTQSWNTFPSTRFLMAFAAVGTVSTLIAGGDSSIILNRLTSLAKILLMYLIVIQCVNTEGRVRVVRWVLGCLIFWLAVGGVLFGNGYSMTGFSYDIQQRVQYTGIFSDPNDLAQLYAILFTMVLYYVVNGRRWYLRIPAAAIVGLSGWAIVLTASRGGVLGAIVGVFLCFRKRMGTILPAVLAGGFLVTMMAMGVARMDMMHSDESSAELRLLSWAQGWYMLRSHPVIGVGLENWYRYHHGAAHNSFIQVAAETGLIGLLLWLGFFYFPMKDSLRAILPGRKFASPPFAAAQLQAALVVWFVTALFLTRNQTMLPYIFAGLVIAGNHVKFQPEAQEEAESEASLAAVGEEESEPQVVSGPLVSWADMRHVSYFLILCMLWWRFMIRGFVPNL